MTVLNYIYVIVDVLKMEFRNSAKSITLSLAADEFGKHVIISSPYSFTDFWILTQQTDIKSILLL